MYPNLQQLGPQCFVPLMSDTTVRGHVENVNERVQQLLQSATKASAEVRQYRPVTYVDNSWNWSSYNVNIGNNYGGGRRARDEDNKDAIRWLVGIVGTIIVFVGAYFIGKNWAQLKNTNETLEDIREDRLKWDELPTQPGKKWQGNYIQGLRKVDTQLTAEEREPATVQKVKKIDDLMESIPGDERNSSIRGLILKISLVASAAIAVIGAIVASPELMAFGAIAGGVSIALMLIKLGMDNYDQGPERKAKKIQTLCRELLEMPRDKMVPALHLPEVDFAPPAYA